MSSTRRSFFRPQTPRALVSILALAFAGCTVPKTPEAFRDYARNDLDHEDFSNVSYEDALMRVKKLKADCFSKNVTVKSSGTPGNQHMVNGTMLGSPATGPSTYTMLFNSTLREDDRGFFLTLQRDESGPKIGYPDGGLFVLLVDVEKNAEIGRVHYLSYMGYRYGPIAKGVAAWMKGEKRLCPSLADTMDLF